jgi:lipopolysaccharide biosynthesis protein
MFWFNPKALRPLERLDTGVFGAFQFEEEAGQRDGTLAHSIERIFVDVALSCGYSVSDFKKPGEVLNTDDLRNSLIIEGE